MLRSILNLFNRNKGRSAVLGIAAAAAITTFVNWTPQQKPTETINSINTYTQTVAKQILSQEANALKDGKFVKVPYSEYMKITVENPRSKDYEVNFFKSLSSLLNKLSKPEQDKLKELQLLIDNNENLRKDLETFCWETGPGGTYEMYCEQMSEFLNSILDKYGNLESLELTPEERSTLSRYKDEINQIFATNFKGEINDFAFFFRAVVFIFMSYAITVGLVAIGSNNNNHNNNNS